MDHNEWVDSLGLDELVQGDVVGIEVAGREVAIYAVAGQVYATDNLCTHGQARLCDGFLEGHAIECPLHQGAFDIRSGQPLRAPVTEALRTYDVKIEGTRVYVRID